MFNDPEIPDLVSERTSTSDAESDEDPEESADSPPCGYYSGNSCLYLYTEKSNQIVYEYQSGRRVARLREPRDLYGVSSSSFFQLPRWPYECQVLKEKVEHIEWDPPAPEPMYKSSGLEQEPTCVNPAENKVIYQLDEGWKEPFFMCSRVGGNCSPLKSVSPHSCEESDNTLVFESRFESGNLQKVVQVADYDYQLTLRTDLYTDRHTQWYYFRVKNTRAGIPYRFTIINFMKPTSLYNHGMRPLMYSEIDANTQRIGWKRIGDEIKYYKNNSSRAGQSYYSLSWTFRFPHSGDTCYFAQCYPYTYSNLQDYLAGIANDPERSKYCKIRVLCHSLAGNIVYVLTITNPSLTMKEPKKKKKAVILTARVHPGETNSSWMMKGFLDYILSSRSDAQLLRDTFVFKVVPMLNPDGVIVGNYRCSLAGRDLNRNYKSRLKNSFPSIWFTRNMIRRVMGEREILLYCDLHGHSRKQNVFMYGCRGGDAQSSSDGPLCERIFPLMFSKNSADKFSFSACKFKVQRNKEGTGRVVMWKMGIRNSYTLEATFCGSSLGKRRGSHFSTKDLESLGYHFCDTLLDYCNLDQTKYLTCQRQLEEMVKQRVNCNPELRLDSDSILEDVLSDLESSTGGSDSSDWNGPPAHLMELASKVKPRRKLLKSKRERDSQRKPLEKMLFPDPQEIDETARQKARMAIVEQRPSAENVKLSAIRKTRLTKQQGAPSHQDLSAKKSRAGSLDVVQITSTLHRFNWKRPLPAFRNLLSQRCPSPSIVEPYCYYINPDDSFRPNTANDEMSSSVPSPLYDRPSLSYSKKFLSGEQPLETVIKGPVLPLPARATESAPPVMPADVPKAQGQAGNAVRRKSKKMEACSSAPQNGGDYRGGGQRREIIDRLRPEKEEVLVPAVVPYREAALTGKDSLYPTAATKVGPAQNIFPKLMSHSHILHKSLVSTKVLPPTKVKSKGAVQKRKLGKLVGPQSQEEHVSTDHGSLRPNTWKDILTGLQTGENVTLHRAADAPMPAPPKGHLLKNGTSNGFVGFTRKPGQKVSLVPLPKTVPSSH
ncbi:cytosolic carboxypeptidase 2-like isoform X2 [Eleutherodactylus coqui]|uniref:cytosolic carboxypeptidase 2-like isoform X2 n=1 Tax=Eleutherodactylus coqui TaxID=57060 RepID=UPI0034638167